MAAQTPRSIRARLMTLLEDPDGANLVRAREAFTVTRQPASLVDNAYTLETERVREDTLTAEVTARIDRITLTVARRVTMDSETAARALFDTLDDVDRRVRADGTSQGYHMQPGQSRVSRPEGKDYCVGVLTWLCDYDYSETVA